MGRRATQRWFATHKSGVVKPPDAYWLRERYGLTVADYNKMLTQQKGKCAICGTKPKYRLHVDHCHKSNAVRGLLCASCNRGLGLFKDDPKRMRKAIKYLQKSLQIDSF